MRVTGVLRPGSAKSRASGRLSRHPGIYRRARLELEVGRAIIPELAFLSPWTLTRTGRPKRRGPLRSVIRPSA